MKKTVVRLVTAALITALMTVLPGCTFGQPSYLEGTVTILPEPTEGQSPPLVFSACQIIIYEVQTGKLFAVVSIDDNGFYRTNIRPGNYVVDLYRMGSIGRTFNVPVVIEVQGSQTLILDITLDTSMR